LHLKRFSIVFNSFELTAEDSYSWDKENKEKTPSFVSKIKNKNHQIKHEDDCGQLYAFFKNVVYLNRAMCKTSQNGQQKLYNRYKFSTGTTR
jgi:hypothetical protein